MQDPRYWLVVPAAGAGRRLAAAVPKQYLEIAGRSLIEWACDAFAADPRCAGAVFALAAGDARWPGVRARLQTAGHRHIIEAPGGAERAHSVRNALQAIAAQAEPDDLVLVHDAARPCLQRIDVDALLLTAARCSDGALLAAPLADTLKRGDASAPPQVDATLPRDSLWRALTPQAARYATLCAALDAAFASGRLPTDDAQALEWQGARPALVAAAASNIKVTTADDLQLATALLAARKESPARGLPASPPHASVPP